MREEAVITFLRKGIFIKKIELTDFESIYIQDIIYDCPVNCISFYKSTSSSRQNYQENLVNILMLIDPSEHIFILGDF